METKTMHTAAAAAAAAAAADVPSVLALPVSGMLVGPVRSNETSILPGSTSASVRPPSTTEWIQFFSSGISMICTARSTRTEK